MSTVEQAMKQLKTSSNTPMWTRLHQTIVPRIEPVTHFLRAHMAAILRYLILLLVGLLFIFVGLVLLTDRVEIGVPIIAGVLFIGFSAAQFSR